MSEESTDQAVKPSKSPVLMTIDDLSAFLKRSKASLYRDDRDGRIPAPVSLGGSKRYRRGEIRAWLRAGCPSREAWAGRWPEKS